MATTKPYEILGVAAGADESAIKTAFRRAAKECHPDLHADDPAAVRRFKRLGAARDALLKTRRRAASKGREAPPRLLYRRMRTTRGAAAGSAAAAAMLILLMLHKPDVPYSASASVEAPRQAVEEALIPDASSADIKAIRDLQEAPRPRPTARGSAIHSTALRQHSAFRWPPRFRGASMQVSKLLSH